MTAIPPSMNGIQPAGSGVPSPVDAIDLLADLAMRDARESPPSLDAVRRAAAVAKQSIADLESTQLALTEALIASQDRLIAVRALAQINVQGVASDDTVGLLLDKALALSGASQVLLFEERVVTLVRGEARDLHEHTDIALHSISEAPDQLLRTTASDTAIISRLDPDGEAERHLVFFRPPDHPFATSDVPLVEAINSALGVMMAFNELHQRELQQAAVEREHQLASALAQSVITDEPPRSATIDIFARTVPASLTGGDFYVFGQTDGAIWFAVGDVAGKGLPAAMLMTRAVAACRVAFLAHRDESIIEVFTRIEDELFDHLDEAGVFITMTVGHLDESTRAVSLVNAGHSPVLFMDGESALSLAASVPPLGVIRGRVPIVATFVIDGITSLIIGSDGLAEQSSPDEELFGYDRFTELCRGLQGLSSSVIGDGIFETVGSFAAGSPASDDSTLVVITRSGARS
ncbi:PP2C family protein-serine/threonine phosphatase [Agreia bicolorata]|uniref:PPM-type phosphatase domain-containing protein n=1 Tax=Agreia bicolorata TaxID=110935 RepID=A0ABR5CDX6_9MICO|nr:PP2C family protein-serine/threonine phosphatase [Agreia bicolorata]KJC63836.1 hypothetical protein TZ00_12450 [Agreia bicolorata]